MREKKRREGEEDISDNVIYAPLGFKTHKECIEYARNAIKDLPDKTVEQRCEKSKRFIIALHNCVERKRRYYKPLL